MRNAFALSFLLLLSTSCFRTHYENFSPANPNRAPQTAQPVQRGSGWQHFFLFGWIPSELPIDARDMCGSTENIHSIQTRQTFLEGLIESLAGVYYVNIYAPWDGAVYCREKPVTLPPSAAPAPPPATSTP
jgi:hypothetical protein